MSSKPGVASHRATNAKIMALLAPRLTRPLRILDMGCGRGFLLSMLAEEYAARGWSITDNLLGVDIDVSGFAADGVPSQAVDLNRGLPFDAGSFDVVLAIEVLEHTRAPYLLLEEAHRVLVPGGRLVFSVPNVMHALSRLSFLVSGHYYMYPTPSIDIARAGTLAGHISPLPVQYWSYGVRSAGFEDVAYTTDREKRGARFAAALLWPLTAIGGRLYERRMRRYSAAVADETVTARRAANSPAMLAGRSLLLTAGKPAG